MNEPDEPLELSAPLAWRLAPELCSRDAATGEDCSWNHRLWQILRLMDLITTPVHHAQFLRAALGAAVRGIASPRILVSGTADYAMLAQLLAAPDVQDTAEVVVVDRCETPLMLNRWYAQRIGRRIVTARSDILVYEDARPFDVVCTHSFLGQFPPDGRVKLAARWRRLLRAGGAVVTVNRVRPAASARKRVGFTPEQAQALVARARDGTFKLPKSLAVDADELACAAASYARHPLAYPVRSVVDIRTLFEAAGFRVDTLRCEAVAGAEGGKLSGPTTPGGAAYAHIVATRL